MEKQESIKKLLVKVVQDLSFEGTYSGNESARTVTYDKKVILNLVEEIQQFINTSTKMK